MIHYTERIKFGMEQYQKLRNEIFIQQDINPDKIPFDFREYAKYTLTRRITPDKREIINALGGIIYIHNQMVCSAPSK